MSSQQHSPAPPSGGGNRLGEETSPYLLQHRDNPVHWRAWNAETLAEAQAADKPILLSIGYAACHWCHVMAHESFEDEATAELMNRLFVNVKVDREERPDIDAIYQQALALLGEQGGWPLTMFLTPAGEPFWGGTYFPREARYGRPGFHQVLSAMAQAYSSDKEAVAKNVQAIGEALGKLAENMPAEELPPALGDQIAERLVREFDPFHGGIGQAPKFPQCSLLNQLWRTWKRSSEEPYRHAVQLALNRMSQGGIYDHLGGGFARYSVDQRWLVPHFEKMLYDNAQLVETMTLVWQETGEALLEARIRETIGWVLREMMAVKSEDGSRPCGAFAASLDADSEGVEGKFYVWDEAEIDRLLGPDALTFKAAYGVTPQGNWEGHNILNRSHQAGLDTPEAEAELARLRAVLLEARDKRVWPGWDDKVLADWNGLMIAALAKAAFVFKEPGWRQAAERAFAFVLEEMTRPDEDGAPRLLHAWRHGRLAHPATLDDYAHMAAAALALHETGGDPAPLEAAHAWIEILDRHYWDAEKGGYFLTADDADDLIVRTKTIQDNATPAGNGALISVLARLNYLTGEERYREKAEALIAAFAGEVQRNIFGLSGLLMGAELLREAVQVVVIGAPDSAEREALLDQVRRRSLPNLVLQVLSDSAALPEGHPAAGKSLEGGKATAYVCRNMTCSLPITEPEALGQALDEGSKAHFP